MLSQVKQTKIKDIHKNVPFLTVQMTCLFGDALSKTRKKLKSQKPIIQL